MLTRVFGRGMLLQVRKKDFFFFFVFLLAHVCWCKVAPLLMMALKTPTLPLQEPVREFAPRFLEALLVCL